MKTAITDYHIHEAGVDVWFEAAGDQFTAAFSLTLAARALEAIRECEIERISIKDGEYLITLAYEVQEWDGEIRECYSTQPLLWWLQGILPDNLPAVIENIMSIPQEKDDYIHQL